MKLAITTMAAMLLLASPALAGVTLFDAATETIDGDPLMGIDPDTGEQIPATEIRIQATGPVGDGDLTFRPILAEGESIDLVEQRLVRDSDAFNPRGVNDAIGGDVQWYTTTLAIGMEWVHGAGTATLFLAGWRQPGTPGYITPDHDLGEEPDFDNWVEFIGQIPEGASVDFVLHLNGVNLFHSPAKMEVAADGATELLSDADVKPQSVPEPGTLAAVLAGGAIVAAGRAARKRVRR